MQRFLVLLCVSVPSFMINLDSNIVAVSLPSIARSLNADFAAIEWVISAYTLSFAALVLPAGTLADRYGRKRILIAGLALFTAASLVCGAAPNAGVLNGARAVQGIGAALQLSAALATLSHAFRGAERARAFTFWGSVIGIAITLGPIAGGVITQFLGWEWAFYVNIPVGLAMIALTLAVVEDARDPDAKRLDIAGFVTFAASLFLLTLALISGNHRGWGDPAVVAELVAAAALFAGFLAIEATRERPMVALSFFREPTYVGANAAGLALAAGLLTMLTYVPLYLQSGLGFGPLRTGLAMLPLAVPLFVVPRLVAIFLTHRLSGRAILTIGLVFAGAGLVAMALAAPLLAYVAVIPGLLLAGIGAGFLNGESAKVAMTAIPPERGGMAAGIGGTVRFAGIVIGFAGFGAILYERATASLRAGMPQLSLADRAQAVRQIVAGDLAEAAAGPFGHAAYDSFASGYQAVFLAAAALTFAMALASWLLVRAAETAPVPRTAPRAA